MRTKNKRKWPKVIGLVMLLLIMAGGAYAFSIYHSLTKAVNAMHDSSTRQVSEKREKAVTLEKKEPFSVLLLGVDKRKNDTGRSDSLIVLTVNPNKQSVEMLSIPRDTRTEIIGRGTVDKINHAYAFGGINMSMKTVEHFLDIPIDYFIEVNMDGFKDIVDSVGGVSVNNDLDFTYENVHFPTGEMELDGKTALKYSRMRYEDPRGDFGRQLRQRQIIEGVIHKGASLSSLTNYGDIFDALGTNIKTNLTFDQMVDIQRNYKDAQKHISQNQINGSGTRINHIYYYLVPDSEKTTIQNRLKDHLEINN
jgi:polyisoprenyl-teichoic acid--peptidoglycan teichoic acid transferase